MHSKIRERVLFVESGGLLVYHVIDFFTVGKCNVANATIMS